MASAVATAAMEAAPAMESAAAEPAMPTEAKAQRRRGIAVIGIAITIAVIRVGIRRRTAVGVVIGITVGCVIRIVRVIWVVLRVGRGDRAARGKHAGGKEGGADQGASEPTGDDWEGHDTLRSDLGELMLYYTHPVSFYPRSAAFAATA